MNTTTNTTKRVSPNAPSPKGVYDVVSNSFKYSISYVVFILFYVIIVAFQKPYTDFTVFILYLVSLAVFTINIFYTVFTVKEIRDQLFENKTVQIFTLILIITFVFKFVALSLFIAVFDYGRRQLKNAGYNSDPNAYGPNEGHGYTVRREWANLISSTERYDNYTTICFLALAYLLYSNQLNDATRVRLNYFMCTIISIIILTGSIMLLANGINILKIKTQGDALYVIDPMATA